MHSLTFCDTTFINFLDILMADIWYFLRVSLETNFDDQFHLFASLSLQIFKKISPIQI